MTDNNLQYRYPGTRPFDANDSKIFMGREEDIENLQQKMDIQKLLVMFSRSGLGKSSLINARLVSALKEDPDVLPIPVRIGAYIKSFDGDTGSPIEKFRSSVNSKLDIAQNDIIDSKVFNTEKAISHHLWYFIKGLQLSGVEQNTFVFIFDQFEELFTYPDEEVKEFGKALSELFFVSVPQQLRTVLLAKRQSNNANLTPEERKLLTTPINIKFLMAIRSDKMSLLNKLSTFFPSILQNCYELKPLNRSQATQAIVGPAKLEGDYISPVFEYNDAAVKKILDGLSESVNDMSASKQEEIESFQLQIVCKYVENLVIKNNDINIDADDLGEINVIFENHYRNIIASLPKENQLPARKLLEEKLIVDGIRISMPRVSILKEPGMTAELLDSLVETHILRPEQNNYYEVAHDTLIIPIIRYYDERKLEELKENELKEQEEKSKKDKEELEAKLAEQVRSARRRKKRLQNSIMIIGLLVLSGGVFYLFKQNEFVRNKGKAFGLISLALSDANAGHPDPTKAFLRAYQAVKRIDEEFIVKTSFDLLMFNTFYKNLIVVSESSYLEIVHNGKLVISSSKEGKDTVWDIQGKVVSTFKDSSQINAVSVSPDGKLIITGLENGEIHLYKINGELIKVFPKEKELPSTAVFSPDGKSILLRIQDRRFKFGSVAKLLDLNGKLLSVLKTKVRSPITNSIEEALITCADFAPDGNIITGSAQGFVHVWDKNGKELHVVFASSVPIENIKFSVIRDMDVLLTGQEEGVFAIWPYKEIFTKKFVYKKVFANHGIESGPISYNTRDRQSNVLFTGSPENGMIRTWTLLPGKFQYKWDIQILGHTKGTRSIFFDGVETDDKLFTCAKDGTVKQWTKGLNFIFRELLKSKKIQMEEIRHSDYRNPILGKLTIAEKIHIMDEFFKQQYPGAQIQKQSDKIDMNEY